MTDHFSVTSVYIHLTEPSLVSSHIYAFEWIRYENMLSCPFFPVAAEVKPKTEAEGTRRPKLPPPPFTCRLVHIPTNQPICMSACPKSKWEGMWEGHGLVDFVF